MIRITYNDTTKEFSSPVSGKELLKTFSWTSDKLIAFKANNELLSLNDNVDITAEVKPVYIESTEGSEIYRRSLCFVLAKAHNNLFPEGRLLIGHSLGSGYFYTFGDETISKADITNLSDEMKKIIASNSEIHTESISYAEACELLEKFNRKEGRKQLNYRCPPKVRINRMENFADLYFGPMAPQTGILNIFELMPYEEGFILRFPETKDCSKLPVFVDNPKIYQIFKLYKNWGKTIGVTSVASLNELILKNKINDFIDITETFQAQNYARVAQQIKERGNVKLVLIAGPSSSGKTTSAKKLALHLKALGYTPKVISLDNYYVGRDKNPKDENGNYDYECLEALDIPLLNQNLNDLFAGKDVEIPSYNFDLGQPFYTGEKMHLDPTDILIMEGIHGLNDKLTPHVEAKYKFKVYLSALTQLNFDDHNRVATSDNRLIRRIVRDFKFRGKSAAATIGMWESVQKGERLHIFPFQNNADAVLNTALDYEIPVLKTYASPLLRAVKPTDPEYANACRLLKFLDNFNSIPENYIPKQSIVREFIGGSSFKY